MPPADITRLLAETTAEPHARPATPGPLYRFTAGRWPLPIILAAQAALSLRLIWANTAFTDEATYLSAGHLEWSHWLDGTPVTSFQTYFSGAPVIYPPLGAAADTLGGLAAARGLSLCLMLAASVLLHGVTRRIFDRSAAAFAVALFAGVGATEYLGAFATYDALALTLLALATWLGVRAAELHSAPRLILLAGSGLIVALADATKYASTLFDPVVFAVAALAVWRRHGRGAALGAATALGGAIALALAAALVAGGHSYWQGIQFTTLSRADGTSAPYGIALVSLGWAGIVGVLAVVGAATASARGGRSGLALGIVLAGAVWLAPAEQARIHTFTSLFKHVGFGEWFGAIAAGFALAAIVKAIPPAKADAGLRASWAAVAVCAVIGALLAANQFAAWPNISRLIVALKPVLKAHPHAVLATDNGNVIAYYLAAEGIVSHEYVIDEQAQWQAVFNGDGFTYRDPGTGKELRDLQAYNAAIKAGYFSVIALSDYRAWIGADKIIHGDIVKDRGYRLAVSMPYAAGGERDTFQVWVYRGSR